MEPEALTFFDRFFAALGDMVGFLGRWAQAFASELLDVLLANVGTIAIVVLVYLSYRLLRAGLGSSVRNYRVVGAQKRSNAAALSLKFSMPGYLCLLAAVGLLFVLGDAPYLSALFASLMVVGGVGLVWWGYRIHAAAPQDGALAATEPKGLWLNRNIRSATFVVVGLFVALLALSSLNTQVRDDGAVYSTQRQERVDAIDQELERIVEAVERSLVPPAIEEVEEDPQQALAPEL